MKHRRVHALLTAYGHTPAKALEIIRDASTGDRHALTWIRFLRTMRRPLARERETRSRFTHVGNTPPPFS